MSFGYVICLFVVLFAAAGGKKRREHSGTQQERIVIAECWKLPITLRKLPITSKAAYMTFTGGEGAIAYLESRLLDLHRGRRGVAEADVIRVLLDLHGGVLRVSVLHDVSNVVCWNQNL